MQDEGINPSGLLLGFLGMAILMGLWVFLIPGQWPRAIGIIAVFLLIAFI